MNGPTTGILVFACLLLAGLGGMAVQTRMPASSLTPDAANWVRRGVTLVIVIAAIVFAYATVSVKNSFDQADRDVKHLSVQLVELDRTLRRIGPDAVPLRDVLFRYANRVVKDTWPERGIRLPVGPMPAGELREQLRTMLEALPAGDPVRTAAISEARLLLLDIVATRLTIFENSTSPLSSWLEAILLAWVMLAFGSLGLTAPRSPVVVASLLLLASVLGSGAFLIQEYEDPFKGVIVISSTPMENALFTMTE